MDTGSETYLIQVQVKCSYILLPPTVLQDVIFITVKSLVLENSMRATEKHLAWQTSPAHLWVYAPASSYQI